MLLMIAISADVSLTHSGGSRSVADFFDLRHPEVYILIILHSHVCRSIPSSHASLSSATVWWGDDDDRDHQLALGASHVLVNDSGATPSLQSDDASLMRPASKF